VKYSNGTVKNNRDGSPLIEEVIRSKGCSESSFLKKHGINYESHPSEFIEVFLLFEDNTYSNHKKEIMSIKQVTKWTNLKAHLSGAFPDCNIYQDFIIFLN